VAAVAAVTAVGKPDGTTAAEVTVCAAGAAVVLVALPSEGGAAAGEVVVTSSKIHFGHMRMTQPRRCLRGLRQQRGSSAQTDAPLKEGRWQHTSGIA
jgi:hypothetical protein